MWLEDGMVTVRELVPEDAPVLLKWLTDSERQVFGMDQFLGEPGLWGKGIGRKFIRLILKHLFEDCGAEAVVLDPHADNLRAIRCYEACGFRKETFLPAHELHEGKMRDCWLMVCRDSPNDRKADTQ